MCWLFTNRMFFSDTFETCFPQFRDINQPETYGRKSSIFITIFHVFLTTCLMMRVGGFDFPWLVHPCIPICLSGGCRSHHPVNDNVSFPTTHSDKIWVFPKIGGTVPQNGWVKIMETLWPHGWFGGSFPTIFWKHPKMCCQRFCHTGRVKKHGPII